MIVLASTSRTRMALLINAGIAFESVAAPLDERQLEQPLLARGALPAEIASHLADAKAMTVAPLRPDAFVIGSDQVLDLDDSRIVKPADRASAAAQLLQLAGRTHYLRTAVSIARGNRILWRHLSTAALTMRTLDRPAIELYLDRAGEDVLGSVGAYLLEGIGIQLFSAIEGDYFSILGLPLLPLLTELRRLHAIES